MLLRYIAIIALALPLFSGTVPITPTTPNWQDLIKNSPEGTTFVFAPGLYRLDAPIVARKGESFISTGGAVLNGAEKLQLTPEGSYWTAYVQLPATSPGKCDPTHPNCNLLFDLFIDGAYQHPVRAPCPNVGPGEWCLDQSVTPAKLYAGTNPKNYLVELGRTAAAIVGPASQVLIDGLVIEKFASLPQHGAVGGYNQDAQSWTVQNTEIRWNHGTGIELGSNSQVRSCNIHHNGQKGLGTRGDNGLIENNQISYNNYAGYDPGWEAGGTKFAATTGLIVRNNYLYGNHGSGLWTDIDNKNTLYEGNRCINNQGEGIRHEISYDAVIRNNFVQGNVGGIVIAVSANVQVYSNSVDVPPSGQIGIGVDGGERKSTATVYTAHDISIHNNQIVFGGPHQWTGLNGPPQESPNVLFDYDVYQVVAGNPLHWLWGNGLISFENFQALGQELHGSITTAPSTQRTPLARLSRSHRAPS